jgi:hypothetical protein
MEEWSNKFPAALQLEFSPGSIGSLGKTGSCSTGVWLNVKFYRPTAGTPGALSESEHFSQVPRNNPDRFTEYKITVPACYFKFFIN